MSEVDSIDVEGLSLDDSENAPTNAQAPPRTQLDYASILWNPIIIDNIFAYSTPCTIIRLSWLCKQGHAAARSYILRFFDINKHLSRFFPDPLAFRALQARTSLLISGSLALQFLDRTFYPGSDLDTYVYIERVPEVATWMVASGYTFAPTEQQPRDIAGAIAEANQTREMMEELGFQPGIYSMRGIMAVFNFVKPVGETGTLKVQIMAALESAVEPILNFHCTCVMNVISYNSAYALYPQATFESRIALAFPRNSRRLPIALQKYTDRGWTVVYDSAGSSLPCFDAGSRWIDDAHAWVLPLPTDGVVLPERLQAPGAQDPVAYTNWQLTYTRPPAYMPAQHSEMRLTTVPRFVYHVVGSPLIRGVYVLTDELLLLAVWGMLKGVRTGIEGMRNVLEPEATEEELEELLAPNHDGAVLSECKTYREAVSSGRVPHVLWKQWRVRQRFLVL